jgi:RNA polymerase sigma factor (sigma-70 family)
VDETLALADRFEAERSHLRAVAYRMLGSLSEADDAVQDAWLRASRAGAGDIDNVGGWLTTIVARICLNMLRARNARREAPLEARLPDPIVGPEHQGGPEQAVLLADSVGLALQIVLETLAPPERLAFVLHDLFDVPFDEIAPLVDRTPVAARQLASRARRRVKAATTHRPDDPARQRAVVDAFFAAARRGDLNALVALLDPDVVLRADFGRGRPVAVIRGPDAVAAQARPVPGARIRPVLVNGAAGVVITVRDRMFSIMGFTVAGGRIVEVFALADPARVGRLGA